VPIKQTQHNVVYHSSHNPAKNNIGSYNNNTIPTKYHEHKYNIHSKANCHYTAHLLKLG